MTAQTNTVQTDPSALPYNQETDEREWEDTEEIEYPSYWDDPDWIVFDWEL